MANTDYRLILAGKIDTKQLNLAEVESYIDKNKVKIKLQIDTAGIQERFDQIRKEVDKSAKLEIFSVSGESGEKAKRAIITYRDELGKVVKETLVLNEKTQTWEKTLVKASHDATTQQKLLNKELDSQARLLEKSTLYADKFLERSKGLQQTPQVKAGVDLAKQINDAAGKGDADKVKKLTRDLQVLDSAIRQSGQSAWSFGDQMKTAITRTLEYATSLGIVYGALRQIQGGIQYITDLNKQMVDIQIATGLTKEETVALSKEYNQLGKEIGATTIEVAKGAVTWLKQGKDVKESSELTRASIMLAKLGLLETGQAAEYLTSTMNGYKKEVGDVQDIISKMVAVDNASATSVAELSAALSRSANIARESGVSFEYLIAAIGTVSSITRRSAESVGESFKTMFSRMADIQRGGLDEEGMSINQVERALARVNITLRESDDSWRSFEDVLKDVSVNWQKYDDITKADIAKTIAGTRQREIFVSLMSNQAMVQDLLNEQYNSGGLALDRYNDYLGGVEAAQNKFTASWEKLWQKAFSSDAIASVYNLGAGFLGIIDDLGGLIPVLTEVVGLFVFFNGSQIASAFGGIINNIKTTISSLKLMGTTAITTGTLMNSAFGLVGLAITGVIAAFQIYDGLVEDTTEKIERLNSEINSMSNNLSSLKGEKQTLQDLAKRYEELKDKTGLNNDEQEEFVKLQNKIKEIAPEVAGEYDKQGNFILDASINLEKYIKLKEREIELEFERLQAKNYDAVLAEADAYKKAQEELSIYVKRYNDYNSESAKAKREALSAQGNKITPFNDEELKKSKQQVEEITNKIKQYYSTLSEARKLDFLGTVDEDLQRILKSMDDPGLPTQWWERVQEAAIETNEETLNIVSEESKKAFDDLLEYTIKMIKQRKEAEIDALKIRLDSIKEERKALEDSYEFQHSEQKRLRDLEETRIKNQIDDLKYAISMRKKGYEEEYEQIEQNFELQEQALESQLESYESLIDAQIRLLENKKKELAFEREMEDKQEELAEIQARILELSFDDSAEAIAERLRLLEQAAEMQEEIDEAVADNQIDQQIAVFEEQKRLAQEEYQLQMAAIEAAKQAAEIQHELKIQEIEREEEAAIRRYELRLRELEEEQEAADYQLEMQKRMLEQEYDAKEKALESQITQLQKYLDEEGTIANDARKMLAENSEKTYQQLIEWNKRYGDGLKDTIVNTWTLALDALNEYKRSLESLAVPDFSDLVASLPSSIWWNGPPPPTEEHHTGLDSGFVGGVKGDEKIIKALKGELILNKDDMKNITQKVFPSMMMGNAFERDSSLGGINIPVSINVAGNLDEKVIPDIKEIMKGVLQELNKSVSNRGFIRQTSLTSI